MNSIVFASNNQHKLRELRRIIGDRMEVKSLADIGCHDDIPETAPTIQGNALIKARWVKERYGYDCVADDTGLMVDALGGEPGVYSARYAGPDCIAENNVTKLLGKLQGVENRGARFVTVIAYVTDEKEQCFEGEVKGVITHHRHGEGGFGYDPVFRPEGCTLTFAEMTPEQKNSMSHRSRATEKFLKSLINL